MGVFSDSRIFHDLSEELRKEDFPCLTYIRDLTDWHDFIRRTPEEYEAWIDGVSKECETLELKILSDMSQEEKPIFVDTNISIETLRTIADHHHVLIMLADTQISVRRFFERPDLDRCFLHGEKSVISAARCIRPGEW